MFLMRRMDAAEVDEWKLSKGRTQSSNEKEMGEDIGRWGLAVDGADACRLESCVDAQWE